MGADIAATRNKHHSTRKALSLRFAKVFHSVYFDDYPKQQPGNLAPDGNIKSTLELIGVPGASGTGKVHS